MPTNKAQGEMREKFVGLYFDGDDSVRGNLKKAASLAGYSWVTVTAKQPKLRAMVANEEARRRNDSQRNRPALVERKEESSSVPRSPVSGVSIPRWYSGSASSDHPTSPPQMTLEVRKRREFEAVLERTAARQAAERNSAFSISYIPKFRRLDD